MINNRTMWSSTFTSFLHPCAVTDVMIDVGVDTLDDTILGVGVDMSTDELAVPIIDVVSVTDVDMLADDENVNVLAAVMTPLGFTLSSP